MSTFTVTDDLKPQVLAAAVILLVVIVTTLSACGGESSAIDRPKTTTTVACVPFRAAHTLSERIVTATRFYECAGATVAQAECLANVTARITPAVKGTTVQLGSMAQQQAMDRCAIPAKTLDRIGNDVGAFIARTTTSRAASR